MLSEILDYAARARARVLAQYANLPRLTALVGELAARVQDLEAALFDVVQVTSIGTAYGIWLDRLGAVVGEPRAGVSDALFRRYLGARVRANTSRGTLEDVIAVVTLWNAAPFPGLLLRELGRATLQVDLDGLDVTDAPALRLARLLRGTRSAGVALELLWQGEAGSKIFTFATSALPEADANAGFGDTAAPATGGSFRSVERA